MMTRNDFCVSISHLAALVRFSLSLLPCLMLTRLINTVATPSFICFAALRERSSCRWHFQLFGLVSVRHRCLSQPSPEISFSKRPPTLYNDFRRCFKIGSWSLKTLRNRKKGDYSKCNLFRSPSFAFYW